MKLAVTADDFGLDAAVNAGIVELAQAGRITSASVMLHRDAVLDGLERLAATGIALGLHLVFVEELPLTDRPELWPLLDGGGRLPSNWQALFPRLFTPSLAHALVLEAEAQLERFEMLGVPLKFVNSHQHTHLFPVLWRALGPLFDRFEGAVRTARGMRGSGAKQLLLNRSSDAAWLAHPLGARTLLQPSGIDLAGHLDEPGLELLLSTIAAHPPPHGPAELVVHPGHESRAMHNRYGHWRYAWQREYELLASPRFPELLLRHGLTLEFPE